MFDSDKEVEEVKFAINMRSWPESDVRAVANFNRHNLDCYQKSLRKVKFMAKDHIEPLYDLTLYVPEEAIQKIRNYCKVKNFKQSFIVIPLG